MLQIAKILKSDGTDGGILLGLRSITPDEIDLKEPLFIYFDELAVPFFIQDLRQKGSSKIVVHLNDVHNLEDAEELVGRAVFIEGELESEDEEDFTGWTLYNRGELVGEISDMEYFPGNPCLCIGEILVPINADFVISVDPSKRILDLDLPDGLL